jgi:hypothetical protein
MLRYRRRLRARAQRGSVLSALLIIVAFLAIVGGALMNELSSQFLLTRTLADRVATQASVNSSVEYAINQLQARSVPTRCSTDTGGNLNYSINLNGITAAAQASCQAIVPDLVAKAADGTFQADGTHVVLDGRDTYLVGNSSGVVYNYAFGQQGPLWSVRLGTGVTGPPAQTPDTDNSGHLITAVPTGNAVALIDDTVGSGARLRCNMPASANVSQQPGFENPPAGAAAFFPDYTFFGDSSGRLYVYDDAGSGGTCRQLASVSGLGGAVVGGPLVLSGTVTTQGGGGEEDETTTTTAELFAVVNNRSAGSSELVHYSFHEVTQGFGQTTWDLLPVDSLTLPVANSAGIALSTTTPVDRRSIRMAITTNGGQVTLASINASNRAPGWTYTLSGGPTVSLGGNFDRAPYWCHCPGADRIGAGNRDGWLFILDTNLNQVLRYQGAVQITTTPTADARGDWYFGANDGYLYDVEPPAQGALMFNAARFGPGSSVQSSPVVGGAGDGCAGLLCVYFGATGAGAYMAQIGSIRVMDLSACSTSGPGSTACVGNPRLWSRLEVGAPQYVGGQGVNVIGWSYFGG